MSSDGFDPRTRLPSTLAVLADEIGDPSELLGDDPLDGLDLHTALFRTLAVEALEGWKTDPPTAADIHPPRRRGSMDCEPVGFGDIEIPVEDEDVEQSLARLFAYRALRSVFVPLTDETATWPSAAAAVDAFESFLPLGELLARPNCPWTEMNSDEAQSWIAFAGIGALRLAPVPDPAADPDGAAWVSDVGWMGDLEVRPGFERYGAVAFFDAEQKPVRIHWCHGQRDVRPGDAEWEMTSSTRSAEHAIATASRASIAPRLRASTVRLCSVAAGGS